MNENMFLLPWTHYNTKEYVFFFSSSFSFYLFRCHLSSFTFILFSPSSPSIPSFPFLSIFSSLLSYFSPLLSSLFSLLLVSSSPLSSPSHFPHKKYAASFGAVPEVLPTVVVIDYSNEIHFIDPEIKFNSPEKIENFLKEIEAGNVKVCFF